jgi:hypothetical protein
MRDSALVSPCPIDGAPTGKDGRRHAAIAWQVREGNLHDTDLSGVAFALYTSSPRTSRPGPGT